MALGDVAANQAADVPVPGQINWQPVVEPGSRPRPPDPAAIADDVRATWRRTDRDADRQNFRSGRGGYRHSAQPPACHGWTKTAMHCQRRAPQDTIRQLAFCFECQKGWRFATARPALPRRRRARRVGASSLPPSPGYVVADGTNRPTYRYGSSAPATPEPAPAAAASGGKQRATAGPYRAGGPGR